MGTSGPSEQTRDGIFRLFARRADPVTPLTTTEVADAVNCTPRTATTNLEELADKGKLATKAVGADGRVWWLPDNQLSAIQTGTDFELEQAQFNELVESVTDYAIFVLDPDGVVQTWNEGAKQMKGYAEEEIVGEHFSTFYTEADRDAGRPERNLEQAAASGRIEDEDKRIRKDGSTFWANVTITALHDDEGNLWGFAKVTKDMTERHEYEELLRGQRDELDELNQINAVIRDIDQALVTATSREQIEQAVCDRLAASETYSAAWIAEYTEDYEEVTPRTWAGISDEYLDAIRTADTETAKETEKGVGASTLRTRTVQHVHQLYNDRNGEPWRDASVTAGYESAITVPLVYNDVEYGVLTVYATHESAFDERKITVLSELGETVSHAIAAIRRKEREQTLTSLQESTRELLNTETQQEIGDIIVKTLTDDSALADALVYCFDDTANRLEPVSSSFRAESTTQLEPITAGADSPVWTTFTESEPRMIDSAVPTDDSNGRLTMVVPLGDYGVLSVTAAEQATFDAERQHLVKLVGATAEAALQRTDRERRLQNQNDRLDSFASLLAHELRNPVHIGQIYCHELPADAAPEVVSYITEAFDRIEDVIDVLLVLTQGGNATGTSEPLSLAATAREAWDEVDATEATLNVEIEQTIQVDETYIHHLFRNLFENAVEHGGNDVTVTVGDLPDGFYVADDGVGIPAEDREAVFKQGYTTAMEQGGTGLGLAFVKELAEVYGWEYRVTESDAGGARIEFTNVHHDSHT